MFRAIPALKSRNCRLYFAGQLISNIGSWMQTVALSWLTLELTNSASLVGIVAAMSALPALLFSLFGGTIADSFSKKRLLLVTNTISMLLAFVLGILTVTGIVNIVEIIVIALLGGIVNSVSTPTHFAYFSELAHKKLMPSAMSINATISSLGRVIGPGVAGLYIVLAGTGGAFILNGFSYIAVIVALLMINTPHRVINNKLDPISAIKEGLIYSAKNPTIRSIFLYVSAMSIFGWSYTTIIPLIAKNVFLVDANGMGYLFSAIGLGAVASTVITPILSKKFSKLFVIILGNTVFSISMFLFSLTSNFYLGIGFLFLAGAGLVSINIVLGTMVQLITAEKYRGRVSSIYYLLYGGLIFLGNLEIGFLSDSLGSGMALRLNTMFVLIISMIIFLFRTRLRRAQEIYRSQG